MALKTSILFLLFLATSLYQLKAQDCLEYPEIGGPECVGCVPTGWTPITGTTPDIIPDDGTWPGGGCMINELSGASPGGGNMSFFASANSSYQEGMSTTLSGLNTNQEYGFSLYWEQINVSNCGVFDPGDLLIILDGEEYEYDGAENWEFIEICFTPSDSNIDIELSISSEGQNVIVVDSPDCDDVSPCCPLVFFLEEEEFEICPGQEFLIEGQLDNSEGDVIIEWMSDPSSGIDFLSATDIINPIFSFPNDENFEGETYEITVTVQDDNCSKEQTIIVIVNPSEVPEFEIIICEIDFIEVLPSVSLNDYTGTWSGDFDFEDLVGTVQEYTFTLDPGQDNCIQEYTYQIPINPAIEITFEYNNSYCVLDDEDYEFPEESEENVEGEWDEDDFNPSDLGVGVFSFTFQPYPEFCAFSFTAEIEIFEESFLSFDIPETFCISNQNYVLPNPSLEGIFGSWEALEIDLSAQEISQTIVFTPEDVNDCYQDYIHTYSVIESINITFGLADTICRHNEEVTFDSTSLEGIIGYWSPLSINPDTVTGDKFTIEWTPLDTSNNCIQGSTKIIIIKEPRLIDINLPESICKNNGIFILPLSDSNGALTGAWNVSNFDPDTISDSNVNLTFTPLDGDCTELYSTTIIIFDNADPVFSFQTEFCSSHSDFILPLIDDNGIEGKWTIPVIQPDLITSQITSVFIPNDILICYNNYEAIFTINNLITPLFDLPEVFCTNDDEFNFLELSINNIQGSWSQLVFNPTTFSGGEFLNTFTPDDVSCNEIINVTIPIVKFDNITNSVLNASSCSANDGSILLTALGDLEFSIDSGLSWQSNPSFENLGAGNYQVAVRHNVFINCTAVFDIQISAPSAPIILILESMNISDCGLSDGSIICVAEGNNLEYSIDNGNSWQFDNRFSDLSVGSYTILVRADGNSNCLTQQNFEINDIPSVLIEDVVTVNISDCDFTDGEITILPSAVIYEFSIDGLNWQEGNIFTGLDQGNYTASIRLAQSPNCFDTRSVDVFAPEKPSIVEIIGTNPSDCGVEDGSVLVEATGSNLEFSIDNGISWSDDNVFSNLPSGIFNIIIQEKDSPNCSDESSITLDTPNTPQVTNFEISQASDCISNDGSIEIFTSISDVEFSMDSGINWQNSGLFENLQPENYTVIIRNISSMDCTGLLSFEILNVPCPCNGLDILITSENVNCFDANSGYIEITDINGFYTSEDYEILWSNDSSDLILNNLSTGWYSYEILYDKNCSLIDSVFLDAFDPINFGLLAFDPNCKEGGSIEVTDIEGGNGQFQFSLDGINFQEDNVFFDLSADEYQIIIEDNYNCSESQNITLNADIDLSLDIPAIQPINYGEVITLNPLINQTTIDSFTWSPISGIIDPSILIVQVSPEQTTEYTLTIYYGDCVETRTITVELAEHNDLYLGNMFSPNFDGNNDYFFIQSSERNKNTIIEFSIFDRWGNLIYNKINPEVNNEKEGWDGSYKNQSSMSGVYPFAIRYLENSDEKIIIGHVTLLR